MNGTKRVPVPKKSGPVPRGQYERDAFTGRWPRVRMPLRREDVLVSKGVPPPPE